MITEEEEHIEDVTDKNSIQSDGNDQQAIEDFASNPIMDRVQRALREQLQKTYERIKRDTQEQQQELRNAKKRREDCGVELYGMQQQLARLQTSLDSANTDHEDLIRGRSKGEVTMEEVKLLQLDKIKRRDSITQAISKRKVELDDLLSSTRQAKLFNLETKDEVAISRRAASKAEETVKGLQKGKLTQDVYIDSLNERIKSLGQDVSLCEQQLSIQKKMTSNADVVIKETLHDLEALVFEKKQLVHQWDSTILALGRRDKALKAASNALQRAEDTRKHHGIEMLGLSGELKLFGAEQDTLVLSRNKVENETKFVEEELRRAESEQQVIAGRYEILSDMVSKTGEEETEIEKCTKRKQSEISSLTQKIETITRDRKLLEEM